NGSTLPPYPSRRPGQRRYALGERRASRPWGLGSGAGLVATPTRMLESGSSNPAFGLHPEPLDPSRSSTPMLKFLRGGRRTAAIWWMVIFGTAVTFVIGFSVAPNLVGGRHVAGSTTLGSVNGEPITQAEVQQSYTRLAQSFSAQYNREPQARDESILREQAWTQLVTERSILQEGKRLGLTASDDEVLFEVRNSP